MAQSSSAPGRARLAAYRPLLDRLIFGLALVGVFVTVHLWVQKQQSFVNGCFGFGEGAESGTFDCGAVLQSGASELFGVSNVVWGFLFYLFLAGLSFAVATAGAARRPALKKARAGLLGFGFFYSLYLVYYQYAYVEEWCALCLTSAVLVTLMLALQVYDYATSARSSTANRSRTARPMNKTLIRREARLLGGLAVLVVLIAGADVLYFAGAEPAAAGAVPDTLQVAEGCAYDPAQSVVPEPGQLVSFADPSAGAEDAPVTVVEYFDPNCPHCKTFYPEMQQLVAEYGQQARFVYKPIPLWEFSVPQVAALYAAQQQGKFKPMLEAQFAMQQQGGLSLDQMKSIAQEIGMDPEALEARIRSGVFRGEWQQTREQARQIGLSGVPAVAINGRLVAGASRTPRCLALMIEAAAEEAPADEAEAAATGEAS